MEIYQTKNYASASPDSAEQSHHSAAGVADHQMNANRSVSPQGPQSWTSPQHSNNTNTHHLTPQQQQQRAQDPSRAHQNDHSIGKFYFYGFTFVCSKLSLCLNTFLGGGLFDFATKAIFLETQQYIQILFRFSKILQIVQL